MRFLGGLGVVLGKWGGGGPWLGGFGGLSLVGVLVWLFLCGGVLRLRGPTSPRSGRVFLALNSLALAF